MKVARKWFDEIVTEDSFGYVSPIIYFQGCGIKCEGCQNGSLQDPEGGREVERRKILDRVLLSAFRYKAVTFQGGEPLDQMADLLWLLNQLRLRGIKTVVYTGYTYERIPSILKEYCDILKCGQYGSQQTVYYKVPIVKTVKHFQYKEVTK